MGRPCPKTGRRKNPPPKKVCNENFYMIIRESKNKCGEGILNCVAGGGRQRIDMSGDFYQRIPRPIGGCRGKKKEKEESFLISFDLQISNRLYRSHATSWSLTAIKN